MADIYMTSEERNSIKTLLDTVKKLPPREQDHVVWFSQGLLYASGVKDSKNECNIDVEEN